MAILSVAGRSLAAVAVRAAGVDLLGVGQAGIEQNADRLGPVELAGEGVQAGQQPVGEADLDRAAGRWAAATRPSSWPASRVRRPGRGGPPGGLAWGWPAPGGRPGPG